MVAVVATVDDPHERMVRRLRERARERKIPLSHLPDRAGVARSHFWDVLAGRKSPTLQWLARVAEALGVDVEDLLARSPRGGSDKGGR